MKVIYDFLSLFIEEDLNIDSLKQVEDLYMAKISYNIIKYTNPDIDEFINASALIADLLGSNTFEFSFKVIENDTLQINIQPELVQNFFSDYKNNKEKIQKTYEEIINKEFDKIEKNETIILDIFIKKPLELEKINRVYFFDEFVEYFSNLDLKNIIGNSTFNHINKDIIFLIDQSVPMFYTKSIYFVHKIEDLHDINLCCIGYENISIQHKLNCHFINSNLKVNPYTFKLEKNSHNEAINLFFNKLTMLTSLIYISNYSEIKDANSILFHINGYKLINENFDFINLTEFTNSFFDIFDWVYKENNISEKLELTRNIISLDFKSSLNDIDDKTLASIKSNYNIYLKENVDQYIELKNQITEHILNLSMKSLDIVNEFSSNFKNAFLANLSFIFTIVILNIINDPTNVDNVFNKELSILYISVIVISFIYLLISKYTTTKDLEHYDDTFSNLKSLYVGLLSAEDLNETFNNVILNSDKIYIKKKINLYYLFWLATLVISILCLYALSDWSKEVSYDVIQTIFER